MPRIFVNTPVVAKSVAPDTSKVLFKSVAPATSNVLFKSVAPDTVKVPVISVLAIFISARAPPAASVTFKVPLSSSIFNPPIYIVPPDTYRSFQGKAAEPRLLPVVFGIMSATDKLPVIIVSPTTSNSAPGFVVPMPTLPAFNTMVSPYQLPPSFVEKAA